jgi:predicted ATPase
MSEHVFLRRVALRNYKSIERCDVALGPLTYLVGANGVGKSNFLDALHLVADALQGSLDNALSVRGGIEEVRRKSAGHPTHFAVHVDFVLRSGGIGSYGFAVGARPNRGYEVTAEHCELRSGVQRVFFRRDGKAPIRSSEVTFPVVASDRLALVSASGFPSLRPAFDALASMAFYNLNPKLMREPQRPQDGRLLKPAGENLASVLGHLERTRPDALERIVQFLAAVVPSVHGVRRSALGPLETIEFRQPVAGSRDPWKFPAMNMSDGTLRVLGILVSLFQGGSEHEPSVVGIEEPETALHPGASAALRAALNSAAERTQVLVTSHSPELLDDPGLLPDQLLAVSELDGKTAIAPVDSASREILTSRLFSAGELLKLGQLRPAAPEPTPVRAAEPDLFADLA